jgi:TetR/AcrR family transcriptional repressor of nem operon
MSSPRPKPRAAPKARAAPKRRAETKDATRAALIAAAYEEFGERGLDASLDHICARAGVTRGAFYVHFEDRDALITAVMRHVMGDFVALLAGTRPEAGGIERAIRLFFAAAQARSPVIHGGRGLRFFHLMDACRRSPEIGTTYRELMMTARDRIAVGFEHDQRAGHVRDDVGATAIAELLTIAALGVVAMLELDLPLDLARLGETLLGVVERRAP